jgi:hypothetical protein
MRVKDFISLRYIYSVTNELIVKLEHVVLLVIERAEHQ